MPITVKQIIEQAAGMLGMSHVTFSGSQVISSFDPVVVQFVSCVNAVLEEIATEYVPCVKEEVITVTDRKAEYTSFSQNVFDIIKITADRQVIDFEMFPSYLEVGTERPEVTVRYKYIPAKVNINSTVANAKLSARVIALGTAAEFALIDGRYAESVNLDKQYMYALMAAARKSKEVRIKGRRWG